MSQPILGGVTLRNPTSSTRSRERVETIIGRANGSEVTYSRGYRYVWALAWTRLPAVDADAIADASAPMGSLAFVDVDGFATTVRVSEPAVLSAIPGTDPVRYDVTLSVREPDVRR